MNMYSGITSQFSQEKLNFNRFNRFKRYTGHVINLACATRAKHAKTIQLMTMTPKVQPTNKELFYYGK